MPCYLVIDGKKQEMDEDIFDQMVEALNPETVQEPPIQTSTRWKPDGTYDSKPLDPEYFSKYYQKKLSTPFKCPDCGRTISSNPIYPNTVKPTFVWETDANVERCFKTPYGTFRSKGFPIQNFLNNKHFYWEGFYVEVQPQSQKFQQATNTQNYLKKCHLIG